MRGPLSGASARGLARAAAAATMTPRRRRLLLASLLLARARAQAPTPRPTTQCQAVLFPTTHSLTQSADGALSVFATDIDGDGDVDAVSASAVDDTVRWYANADRTFEMRAVSEAVAGAYAVHAADLDGDADVDLVSAAYGADGYGGGDTVHWHQAACPTLVASYSFDNSSAPTADDGTGDSSFAGTLHNSAFHDPTPQNELVDGCLSFNETTSDYMSVLGGTNGITDTISDNDPRSICVWARARRGDRTPRRRRAPASTPPRRRDRLDVAVAATTVPPHHRGRLDAAAASTYVAVAATTRLPHHRGRLDAVTASTSRLRQRRGDGRASADRPPAQARDDGTEYPATLFSYGKRDDDLGEITLQISRDMNGASLMKFHRGGDFVNTYSISVTSGAWHHYCFTYATPSGIRYGVHWSDRKGRRGAPLSVQWGERATSIGASIGRRASKDDARSDAAKTSEAEMASACRNAFTLSGEAFPTQVRGAGLAAVLRRHLGRYVDGHVG